jgi:predicted amidohydrolase
VIDLIRQAKSKDITLLVFPETFIPGYPYFIECYPPLKQVSAIAQYAEVSMHNLLGGVTSVAASNLW